MSSIKKIKEPIIHEMNTFEPYFKSYMKSKAPLLNIITSFILKRKGKQVRPMFVFLSAKLTGQVSDATYRAAALLELMHTATLIHDDVVDNSYERRGFFSVNALWKNKIAVLVGDYLLSKGLLLAVDNSEFEILRLFSDAVKEMAEGELLQIEKARRLDINEEIYFEVIRKKTAVLFAACTACGARSAGADKKNIEKIRIFGEYTGIAFQIKDDLFDYLDKGSIGKPIGNDIKEKKLTLPLIYVLKNCTKTDKNRIIRLVRRNHNEPKKVKEVIDFVKKNGGIEYATGKMLEYRDKALELLSDFPDNPSKEALTELVNYTTNRQK